VGGREGREREGEIKWEGKRGRTGGKKMGNKEREKGRRRRIERWIERELIKGTDRENRDR
jgi:hypothetical protein